MIDRVECRKGRRGVYFDSRQAGDGVDKQAKGGGGGGSIRSVGSNRNRVAKFLKPNGSLCRCPGMYVADLL